MNVKRKRPPLYCSVARIHAYPHTHTHHPTYNTHRTDGEGDNGLVNKRMNSKWQHGNKTIYPRGKTGDDATLSNDTQTRAITQPYTQTRVHVHTIAHSNLCTVSRHTQVFTFF